MAKGTLNPAVTKTEVIEVTPQTVTLELSLEEAKVVKGILGRFLGVGPNYDIFKAIPIDSRDCRGRIEVLRGFDDSSAVQGTLKWVPNG